MAKAIRWKRRNEAGDCYGHRAIPYKFAPYYSGSIAASGNRLCTPFSEQVEENPRWPVSGDPEEQILVVRGEITNVSKARTAAEAAPYRDTLMTVEYKVLESHSGGDPYQPERIVVLVPALRNAKSMAATRFKPGMTHTLALASWEAQPKKITQWPIDDDIIELELPMFYALGAAVTKGRLRTDWLRFLSKKVKNILEQPAKE